MCACLHLCMDVCISAFFFFLNQLLSLISLPNRIKVLELTPDHLQHIEEVTIEKDQTQMIRSKKGSVMLNEVSIPEHHVKKELALPNHQFESTVFRKLF